MMKMDIKTEAKHIRISSRKMRLVAEAIRSLSPQAAMGKLKFINKRAAKPISKAIKAALADAKNNFNLDETQLKFKEIRVGEGPTLKRWQPISRGRAHQIMKRTSHLKIILKSKVTFRRNPAKRASQKSK